MGRRKKPVDAELVYRVARLCATQEEISEICNISVRTLQRRFGTVIAQARAHVKMSLRRAQYLRATRDRSDKMLIHLGKCELGQRPGEAGDTLHSLVDGLLQPEEGDDHEHSD
jgi:hypothetical protein